jgi:ribonuclease HI
MGTGTGTGMGVGGRGGARKGSAVARVKTSPVEHGAVVVYADGACSGNPGPAGLGVVVIDGPSRIERSEYLGRGTNNVAELTAVMRALEAVPDRSRPVAIHTDSQYAIGVLSLGWKAKKNRELIEQIRQMLRERPDVRFVHVRGHSGIPLNERADELARQAITERATNEQVFGPAPRREHGHS